MFRSILVTVALVVMTTACTGVDTSPQHTRSVATRSACSTRSQAGAWDGTSGSLAYSLEEPADVFLTVDSQRPIRLTSSAANEFDPDVSPDGAAIAYRRNPDPQSDEADIWIVRRDGTGRRNLTKGLAANNWSPAWSPDGERIAFASGPDGALSVWTMRTNGRGAVRVTDGPGEYPDWSPDGGSIVYAAASAGGSYDVFTVPATGGEPRRLTESAATDFAPAWSPDGERIAFQSERDGDWGVWLMWGDGSGECQLATPGAFPTWISSDAVGYAGPGGIDATSLSTGGTWTIVGRLGAGFPSWSDV